MPWVRFLRDFDYHHASGKVVTAYKAGMEQLVKQDCADRALAAGAAELAGRGGEAPGPADPMVSRPRRARPREDGARGGR